MDKITYKVKLQNKAQEIRDQIEDFKFMIEEEFPRRIKQLERKEGFLIEQINYLNNQPKE